MTRQMDPADTLRALRNQLKLGEMEIHGGARTGLHALPGKAGGPSLSFLHFEDDEPIAWVDFAPVPPVDGLPCYNLACAATPEASGRGVARAAIGAALAELKGRLAQAGTHSYLVEALVLEVNLAARHLAESLVSPDPIATSAPWSGQPAFRYLGRFEAAPGD
jgi:hypothetical protein